MTDDIDALIERKRERDRAAEAAATAIKAKEEARETLARETREKWAKDYEHLFSRVADKLNARLGPEGITLHLSAGRLTEPQIAKIQIFVKINDASPSGESLFFTVLPTGNIQTSGSIEKLSGVPEPLGNVDSDWIEKRYMMLLQKII